MVLRGTLSVAQTTPSTSVTSLMLTIGQFRKQSRINLDNVDTYKTIVLLFRIIMEIIFLAFSVGASVAKGLSSPQGVRTSTK